MNLGFLGLIGFIVALFTGRWINERALNKLDDKQRSDLLTGLSKYRLMSLAGVVLIVVGYFVIISVAAENDKTAFPFFAGILIFYMLAGTAYVYWKLKSLQVSEDYINAYMLSTTVQYVGLILYFTLSSFG